MDILMSIKPEYVERICSGLKKYEYRKRIPRLDFQRIYMYSSYPVKKIVGYLEIDYILKGTPIELWDKTFRLAGIDKVEYQKYFYGSIQGYSMHISKVVLFDTPINPYAVFCDFKPPQSFMYFNRSCFE